MRKYYTFRAYQEFRNEVDWDIEETGENKEEVIAAVLKRYLELGNNPYCFAGEFTLRSYYEVEIKVDGEEVTFTSNANGVRCYTPTEMQNHPVVKSFVAAREKERADQEAASRAQIQANRMAIYEQVRKELDQLRGQ